MTSIRKPQLQHPQLPRNKLGLTVRDYEGLASTLCAGCGHDAITAALVQSLFELEIAAEKVGKLSGIGCSSKSTAYFLRGAHGINAVHGRMPAIATGAAVARHDMCYIGVSGDGDSLSIGLGQLCHAIRRNVNMLYIIENNGVYGLTKGQFSAAADTTTRSRTGESNPYAAIDAVELALLLGAPYVARGFSGDRAQLVSLLKGGLKQRGFALVDIISPCVTFNDHRQSTKSYMYTRANYDAVTKASFVPPREKIAAPIAAGTSQKIPLHDGSQLEVHSLATDYDPCDREAARAYLQKASGVVTGLLYVEQDSKDLSAINALPTTPLAQLTHTQLCPGAKQLDALQESYR